MRRLVQYSIGGRSSSRNLQLGALLGDEIAPMPDWPDARSFLSSGAEWPTSFSDQPLLKLSEVKLHAPVHNASKVICIGLNYKDHAHETKMAVPKEPVVFSKFPSSLIGPYDDIRLPPPTLAHKLDYEAELVVIMGKSLRRATSHSQALDAVAGYTVGNDLSARDLQLEGNAGQWLLGKALDEFAPIGPSLVMKSDDFDPNNLRISCAVNGHTVQRSSTNQFIFPVPVLLCYLSQYMTLEPGDLIFTGTPPGVAMGRDPPVWLQAGDVVTTEIEHLGQISNRLVADAQQ